MGFNSGFKGLMEARVLCEVRTEFLCKMWILFSLQGVKNLYFFLPYQSYNLNCMTASSALIQLAMTYPITVAELRIDP